MARRKATEKLPLATEQHSARNIPASYDVLAIAQVRASSINPRKYFDEAALTELADSIRRHGLKQPIGVRRVGVRREQGETTPVHTWTYEIIWGERRWRAAQLAGLTEIPAMVHTECTDLQALELALLENLARRDIDPIEEAMGYAELVKLGVKQTEIAERVNRSQPAIANAMRLLDLPDDVQERIRTGKLTVAHGITLCRFKAWPSMCSEIAALAVKNGATSKDLERDALPYSHALKAKKVHIGSYGNEPTFDVKKVCGACEFTAWIKQSGGYGHGYCLKPDHFKQMQAEGTRERERAAKEAAAAAKAGGKKVAAVLELDKLPYGSYAVIDGKAPEGCSAKCECRAKGKRWGSEVKVCTDPKRYRKLERAQQKAAKDVKLASAEDRISERIRHIVAQPFGDARQLAVVVYTFVRNLRKPYVERAFALVGVTAEIPDFTKWENRSAFLDLLSSMSSGAILRMAIYAASIDCERGPIDSYGRVHGELLDWYHGSESAQADDERKTESEIREAVRTEESGITADEYHAIVEIEQEQLQEAA